MNLLLSSVSESVSSPLCIDEEEDDLLSSHPSEAGSMSFSLSADSVASLSPSPDAWELSSVGPAGSAAIGCWWTPPDDVGSGCGTSEWPWFWTDSNTGSTSDRVFAATSSMFESSPFSFLGFESLCKTTYSMLCINTWVASGATWIHQVSGFHGADPPSPPPRVLTSSDLTNPQHLWGKKKTKEEKLDKVPGQEKINWKYSCHATCSRRKARLSAAKSLKLRRIFCIFQMHNQRQTESNLNSLLQICTESHCIILLLKNEALCCLSQIINQETSVLLFLVELKKNCRNFISLQRHHDCKNIYLQWIFTWKYEKYFCQGKGKCTQTLECTMKYFASSTVEQWAAKAQQPASSSLSVGSVEASGRKTTLDNTLLTVERHRPSM